MIRIALALTLTLTLAAWPALAGGTLEGRIVTLNTETWDDPAQPILVSRGRTVQVGAGVEFALLPEGRTPGFDVVPVQVEILPGRIEFSYGAARGQFWPATFNGYVLRFAVDCALIAGARVDAAATTMAVTDADISTDGRALFVNVAGRDYGPEARLAVDLVVTDCLLG
ncbi:MAG TPA: hypothetical protein VLA78_06340 [Paracoccaceae bacterium]|nr:hypothetical protein [Paracoccaceae bacterium]